MDCECGAKLFVTDTRRPKKMNITRRSYKCPTCDKRYTTIEQLVESRGSGIAFASIVMPMAAENWKRNLIDKLRSVLDAE